MNLKKTRWLKLIRSLLRTTYQDTYISDFDNKDIIKSIQKDVNTIFLSLKIYK